MVWFVLWIKLCEKIFFFFLFCLVKIRKELSNFCKNEKKKIYLLQSLKNSCKILPWWTPRSKHRVVFFYILINLINVVKIELCWEKKKFLGFFYFRVYSKCCRLNISQQLVYTTIFVFRPKQWDCVKYLLSKINRKIASSQVVSYLKITD
jgi:hypothetical protein